jgi:hypothetical protein
VVQEDQTTSIRLVADSRAATGHSHPVTITQEQLRKILAGIRVQNDPSSPIGSTIETSPVRAFSADEIRALGPGLAIALSSASPEQIVTFYRASPGEVSNQVVTSGGLFVEGGHLHLILANYRIKTDAAPREEAVAGVVDVMDNPLVPILRGGYTVTFEPSEAWVPRTQRVTAWNYLDDRKVVVIDLDRLLQKQAP